MSQIISSVWLLTLQAKYTILKSTGMLLKQHEEEYFLYLPILTESALFRGIQPDETQEMLQDKLAQTQETLQSKISQLETQITGAKNYSLNHRFRTAIKAVFGKPLL